MIFIIYFVVATSTEDSWNNTFKDQRTCRKKNHQLLKKHTYCFIPLIKNLEALLSDKELRKALLQSNYNRSDSKLEFLQDGVVLSNHPLFAIDGNTLGLILYSDEIERCNAVGTRVKKHKLLLFYYLVSNLPKKYCSVLDAINLFAVVKSEDIATYGFDIILEPFLNDLKQHSMPDGYPTNLKDGETICMRASLVAYVADNPTAHKAIGLKESVGGALRKCRFCNADNNAMQNGFREEDFEA